MSEDSKFADAPDKLQFTHEEREAQLIKMIEQFQKDWNEGWRPRPGVFTIQWKGDDDL